MDRRDFVLAGSLAAAAASARWLHAGGLLGTATDVADAGSTASPAASIDVFGALVRAILPSDDPRFAAVAPAKVQARANSLFSIDRDAGTQQNFSLFNELHLFQIPPPALTAAELALYPAEENEKGVGSPLNARIAQDSKQFQSWSDKLAIRAQLFSNLRLADQRTYLMLWARSALGLRRRLYQSTKTLVMVATYSMDESWPIVGYAGPLLRLPAP